jgi:hypothetical protein
MLRKKIEVGSLLPSAVETKPGEVILRQVDSVVKMPIADHRRWAVKVVGSAPDSLTFDVHSKIALLAALACSESLSPEAGREVLASPAAPDPSGQPLKERAGVSDRIQAASPQAGNIPECGKEVQMLEAGRGFDPLGLARIRVAAALLRSVRRSKIAEMSVQYFAQELCRLFLKAAAKPARWRGPHATRNRPGFGRGDTTWNTMRS